MSWSNVTIPDRFSRPVEMAERIRMLEFELKDKTKTIDSLYSELENIFAALKEYQEISISLGKETLQVKLVEVQS